MQVVVVGRVSNFKLTESPRLALGPIISFAIEDLPLLDDIPPCVFTVDPRLSPRYLYLDYTPALPPFWSIPVALCFEKISHFI
jgi:hypothetical protein